MTVHELVSQVEALGAAHAAVIPTEKIETDAAFRGMCEVNSCGRYGKCWMCPPDVGDIQVLMAEIKAYRHALVYQLIGELDDSFDFEGMQEAKKEHNALARKVKALLASLEWGRQLHLAAGGCGVCKTCAKEESLPCRFPEKAISSLEAYGVHVAKLAASAGMKYINGANTVTYFGMVLFDADFS